MTEGSELAWRARRVAWLARSPLAKAAAALAVPGGAWLWLAHPVLVADLGRVALGVAVGLAGWAGWATGEWLVLRRHRRERVEPLGWAVRHELGYPDDLPAGRFISWDPDFGEQGTEIVVFLPRHWIGTDEQRRRLVRAVVEKGRFNPDEISHRFILDGRFGYLRVTPREQLVVPRLVRASEPEVRALLEETTSGRALLALCGGGEPYRADLDDDAPHIGISMETGEGKSNTVKGIVAQEMHEGASAVVLDIKRRSLKFLKGLEGVEYWRDIEDMNDALIRVAAECDRRNRLADDLGDDEEPPWQRLLLVFEEVNSTIPELVAYWAEVRSPQDPRVSPALRAWRTILNTGRQSKVNVIGVFQSLTAAEAGGPTARRGLGLKVMAGFDERAWKMLAGGLPMPMVAGKPKGRTWYVRRGRSIEGQGILWTDRQAREWATTGVPSARRASTSATPVSLGERPARRAGSTPVLTVVAASGPRLYTLRQASCDEGDGVVPVKHQRLRGLRSGSDRDPDFPAPDKQVGQRKLYAAETLQRWHRNREQAG